MSASNEYQKTELAIPPFLKRWSIFFRRHPSLLWDVEFLFDVIIRRNPIFWNNVMEYEKKHSLCKWGEHTEECRKEERRKFESTKGRPLGIWRDEP